MNPCLLLKDYAGQNVRGWLMSEKADGWRTGWDGQNFWSREGWLLDAPEWFKAGMPAVALDGEIWAGRGGFHSIQGRMRDGWHGLEFFVFDAPRAGGGFAQRLAHLKRLELPAQATVAAFRRCRDTAHLLAYADGVVAAGGEGAVVRRPGALWRAGRCGDVLRWVPQSPACNRRAA